MRSAILSLSFLVMMCGLAMARPRDDVMINAYRCAGQTATRNWLDCYYGAAQPQRALLRLSPAPTAQTQLMQTAPSSGAPQDAAARDAVMAAAGRCGSALGERPWLDCYYAAANPVRVLLGLAPVTVASWSPAQQPQPVPRTVKTDLLGHVGGKPVTLSVSRMASYHFDRNGLFTVTLENGEVWQQLDGDSHVAHWTNTPRDYVVTITTGAFKSVNLTASDAPTAYKVRPIGGAKRPA